MIRITVQYTLANTDRVDVLPVGLIRFYRMKAPLHIYTGS